MLLVGMNNYFLYCHCEIETTEINQDLFSQTLWLLKISFYLYPDTIDETDSDELIRLKTICIGCMPDFSYGDYVYLNDIDDTQNIII